MGIWAFNYFAYRRSDDVKQKNKNHETIPSRFSLNRKKRVFCFTSSVSSAQNFPLEFAIHQYLDKFSIHLVRESVHLTVSLGI